MIAYISYVTFLNVNVSKSVLFIVRFVILPCTHKLITNNVAKYQIYYFLLIGSHFDLSRNILILFFRKNLLKSKKSNIHYTAF